MQYDSNIVENVEFDVRLVLAYLLLHLPFPRFVNSAIRSDSAAKNDAR